MKRFLTLLLMFILVFTLQGCGDDIEPDPDPDPVVDCNELPTHPDCIEDEPDPVEVTLNLDIDELTLIEGGRYTITPVTNDELGVTFSVSAAGIITLSSDGDIVASNEGTVTVTVTSLTDRELSKTIVVFVRKEIILVSNLLIVNFEEEQTHQLIINSNDDYEFDVANTEIIHVDEDGIITALNEGTTTITVTSLYDTTKSVMITVNVSKKIELAIDKEDYLLVVGDTSMIEVTSNDTLNYISGDNGIVTVAEDGTLEAIGFGVTTIRVESQYNPEVFEIINITVYKYTEGIAIVAPDRVANGTTTQLSVDVSPVGAYDEVVWESLNTSMATIDLDGNITALNPGMVDIAAKSVLDDEIVDIVTIEIINIVVVYGSATLGSTYDYEGVILDYGEQLFSSISDAVNASIENTTIFVDAGFYMDNFTIDANGIQLVGISDAISISGVATLSADDIAMMNLTFNGSSSITNGEVISNFVFDNNTVSSISQDFFVLNGVDELSITNSTFTAVVGTVLLIEDTIGGNILIEENVFELSGAGIVIKELSSVDIDTVVKVFFNSFDGVDSVFDVDFTVDGSEVEIFKAARFNKVKNYTTGATSNIDSTFDFTLNYWDDISPASFVNVDNHYLKGAYETEEAVVVKATYNPDIPIIITITNPIDEIMIGETHTFEYEILPYELSDAPVRFITGNPTVVSINQEGGITPLISGSTYIQVRSAIVSSIRTQTDFSIITTPGIELVPDEGRNNLLVGESITLDYILFPYTIENESIVFSTSDSLIATITPEGVVATHAEGMVTLRATLATDSQVYQEYSIMVYDELDISNPLDYMTAQQVSYSTIHKWIAYGFVYNYNDTRAESVSRYYFDNVVINDTKMVPPNSYGIRPSELMDVGYNDFNEDNIYWVVIHDTASTGTGSNALAHANYLYNNAIAENPLWVSWHYTIDDHDIYQHLPEIERGYHAGDGSTNPGTSSTYLGGGNRNGVGIEMAVNDDGDMFRTWQRAAKLTVDILNRNNMPITQFKYHNDFSGKDCPNTLRNAGLIPLFEEFIEVEYHVSNTFFDSTFTFTSNNPDILDNHGRIIQIPQRAVTVSYTIEVTTNGTTESRTFYTYVPGTVR